MKLNILSLFDGMSCGQIAHDLIGDGWTVDVIAHIFSYLK